MLSLEFLPKLCSGLCSFFVVVSWSLDRCEYTDREKLYGCRGGRFKFFNFSKPRNKKQKSSEQRSVHVVQRCELSPEKMRCAGDSGPIYLEFDA